MPLDAVAAACELEHSAGGEAHSALDTLAQRRETGAQPADGAAAVPEHLGGRSPAPATPAQRTAVVRVEHPENPDGLAALLAAIRTHSAASLEQSIADRCYNSAAIRAVAMDVIGWTIAHHFPRSLDAELRWLRHAECELALDESLSLAGADGAPLPIPGGSPAADAVLDVDAVALHDTTEAARQQQSPLGRGEQADADDEEADWWTVQASRLRVRELAVLAAWHQSLREHEAGGTQ